MTPACQDHNFTHLQRLNQQHPCVQCSAREMKLNALLTAAREVVTWRNCDWCQGRSEITRDAQACPKCGTPAGHPVDRLAARLLPSTDSQGEDHE